MKRQRFYGDCPKLYPDRYVCQCCGDITMRGHNHYAFMRNRIQRQFLSVCKKCVKWFEEHGDE